MQPEAVIVTITACAGNYSCAMIGSAYPRRELNLVATRVQDFNAYTVGFAWVKDTEGQRLAGVGCWNLAQIKGGSCAAVIEMNAHVIPGPHSHSTWRRIACGIRHFDRIRMPAIIARRLQGQPIGSGLGKRVGGGGICYRQRIP